MVRFQREFETEFLSYFELFDWFKSGDALKIL